MKITPAEVEHVAELAQLALTPDEISHLAHDLDQILAYIDTLSEVDTSAVEPMAHVFAGATDEDDTATLREDLERPPLSNSDAIANAAASGSGYFKVPKVIER